ncbi:MAG: YqgE/AlgH family protein [Candidatus Thiodiazotropha endolucinida]|nr:YqgE/AlgH family protein [Candidatus Thiodiazotropha endolucinida]
MKRFHAYHALILALLLAATVFSVDANIGRTIISPLVDVNKQIEPEVGMFLVARRSLSGTYFQHSVVYLVKHGGKGTLGLIVNRPSQLLMSEVVENIDNSTGHNYPVYLGGPVKRRHMFMLVRNPPDLPHIEHILDNVHVSVARDILEHLIKIGKPSSELRLYIGHSGWTSGQLDSELADKRWHLIKANTETIFNRDNDSLWERLINKLEPSGIVVDVR